jgi:hypothetical protein
MGQSADDAAKRFATSHKIHAVNLARLRRACQSASVWQTILDGWGPFFTHGTRQRSRAGLVFESGSLPALASVPRSSSGSISARTALLSLPGSVSLSSRCDARTVPSSIRLTRTSARSFESSIASRVEAPAQSASPPEAVSFGRRVGEPVAPRVVRSWNTHLMRVQNLRLSLQFLGARMGAPRG